MVLWSDDSKPIREAARRLKVTLPVVSNWGKRFREGRISGLHDALKAGRPRIYNDERVAELLRALERLDLAFLVDTQNDGFVGRLQVQALTTPHRARSR
jgi:transposase